MDKEKKIQELQQQIDAAVVHECEVYSRVVGYLRPIKQWNSGKREEWSERTKYAVPH